MATDETDKEAFGGYGLAIRTFWVTAGDLSMRRVWAVADGLRPKGSPDCQVTICGRAIAEKDDVCVIGPTCSLQRPSLHWTLVLRFPSHR